jgi:hypothetical protein
MLKSGAQSVQLVGDVVGFLETAAAAMTTAQLHATCACNRLSFWITSLPAPSHTASVTFVDSRTAMCLGSAAATASGAVGAVGCAVCMGTVLLGLLLLRTCRI